MTDTWSNWTGDQTCKPAAIEKPRDVNDIKNAIEHAEARRWTVRAVGAGHSFNDSALTDGLRLSLENMNRVTGYDRSAGTVRVEAGISIRALNEELDARGLALENLGDIDVQSLAGATATGTHGTGIKLRNISASIESIELVTATGSVVEISRDHDPDAWRAARISLGALGIVTAMTLRTVPAFTLRGIDRAEPLDAVLETLEERIQTNDHFEFYMFPYSRFAMTRTNNRVDEAPRERSKASAWLHDVFLVNTVFGGLCRAGRRFHRAIPTLNRVAARWSGGSERVDRSYRIFASPRLVKFTESEYAFPREHCVDAVREVKQMIETNGFDVSFPLEVRFQAPDDAYLAPTFGRETCHMSAHMFEQMEWRPYFDAFEKIMDGFDGRPHWGKRHFQTATTLAPRYPEWDSFQAVRKRLDPDGRFANEHLRRVLG
ncbi:MAG: FAD-binding protein [Actinobacteria bacterium]|nr:FAD-binding protein [Actinomycetota bacterium]